MLLDLTTAMLVITESTYGKEDPRVANLAKACLRQHLLRYGVVSDAMLSALVEARISARATRRSVSSGGERQNGVSLASPFSRQQLSMAAAANAEIGTVAHA